MDCMQGMKEFPDKYFDLAIVDPPYGIGENRKFQKMLVFQCVNMRGLILTELQKNGLECQMKKTEYTQRKNQ